MKITDETKTFEVKHIFGTATLDVSSNVDGTHEQPSVFLHVKNPIIGESAAYGTDDPEQVKEIIQHMAKMAGLAVTITDATEPVDFKPKFQKGDRVRSLMPDEDGQVGTVYHDEPHESEWNVRVLLDEHATYGLYMHHELELVTKNS